MRRPALSILFFLATAASAARASTADGSMSLGTWIISAQLGLIAFYVLMTRYGERLKAWLAREETQLDRARKEGLDALQRIEEAEAERDRIRQLANQEMDRRALERLARATKTDR
jgi:Skp family chaperone for outer membrane proteins